jgi:hypothetical protein
VWPLSSTIVRPCSPPVSRHRDRDQRLVVYMAAPGTPDHDAMVLLDRAALDIPAPAKPG